MAGCMMSRRSAMVLPRQQCRAFATTPNRAQREINELGVIGAGQMGLGIALVAAQKAGVNVTLVDSSPQSLEKGLAFADKLLAKEVSKSRLTEAEARDVRARLRPASELSALASADMIIEAVPEVASLKTAIFSELARIAAPHAILATNTSSISITKIAAATLLPPSSSASQSSPVIPSSASPSPSPEAVSSKASTPKPNSNSPSDAPSRVIGAHFMNPVPVQRGVEIISGLQTSASTLATTEAFVRRMGKTAARAADTPGFLANRILMPYINEAVGCLETGAGARDAIDAIMLTGTGVPMGPLRLADFIGLDTCLSIMRVLHHETGDDKYRPSVLLGRMVDAGWLGKKSGKGFYDYPE